MGLAHQYDGESAGLAINAISYGQSVMESNHANIVQVGGYVEWRKVGSLRHG